ncbi:hypothetical protein ABIB90_007953, partial [Bradyrhizobium sp. JR4.1]
MDYCLGRCCALPLTPIAFGRPFAPNPYPPSPPKAGGGVVGARGARGGGLA